MTLGHREECSAESASRNWSAAPFCAALPFDSRYFTRSPEAQKSASARISYESSLLTRSVAIRS